MLRFFGFGVTGTGPRVSVVSYGFAMFRADGLRTPVQG